ncbi:VirB4 family type IV secretion/conjugal transfer ATPase [Castellaniella sp.]|uniref:VirB4 family type IV secretion/conjugal transfer ATPase n=1 Tax=Castellaniella sp. TaxID=1955812 RepID=UPI002AFF370D|nr:VirB4 family type IV secretion/conjugal transfer ATPase [Castellaniella sp.]
MSLALQLRERSLAQYLRYSHHVTPSIISCGNLEYMSVFRLSGRSWDAAPIEEQREWNNALHTSLLGQRFGATGFHTHIVRRQINDYPHSEYKQPFARRFASRYAAQFDERALMINEIYFAILVRPEADPVLGKLAKMEKSTASQIEAWQAELVERLEGINKSFESAFSRYDPEVLGVVERDGMAYCQIQEYLALILNGHPVAMPVTRGKIAENLPVARPIFSQWGSLAELRHLGSVRTFGMLEVRDLPEKLRPGHLDALLSAPFEFVLSQSFGTFSKAQALKLAERQQRLLRDSKDFSKSQILQLNTALDHITAGRMGLGDHQATLQIFGGDSQQVNSALGKAAAIFSDMGIKALPLGTALEAGFWSQMPGNWDWRHRPDGLSSENFLDLNSFHNQLSGKPTGNPWGPAVAMFKTTSGAPYFFNFHTSLDEVDETGKRRPGNTAIIGKTGTGKTVLLGMLVTMAQKFGTSLVALDKDRGLQVTIMALGGRYFVMRLGEATGWAPLQLPQTQRNLAFMRRLIAHLAASRGELVTTADMRLITEALNGLMKMDRSARRISTLLTFLPSVSSEGRTSVHDRLLPWCEGGDYGWMFDGHTDTLDLGDESSHDQITVGFDLTELFDDPIARSAATLFLDQRIAVITNGRRLIKLVDECQHPLGDKHFAKSMRDDSRTIRKKNGVLCFCTQEVAALLEVPEGQSLIDQAATKCFLPNPTAKWEEFSRLGVTRSVFDLIKSLGEHSRQMVVQQGSSITVVDIGLPGCEDELLVFSGSEDLAIIAEAAVAEVGPDPEVWLPVYLERARIALKSH